MRKCILIHQKFLVRFFFVFDFQISFSVLRLQHSDLRFLILTFRFLIFSFSFKISALRFKYADIYIDIEFKMFCFSFQCSAIFQFLIPDLGLKFQEFKFNSQIQALRFQFLPRTFCCHFSDYGILFSVFSFQCFIFCFQYQVFGCSIFVFMFCTPQWILAFS